MKELQLLPNFLSWSRSKWLSPQEALITIITSLLIAIIYFALSTISLEFISLPGKIASVWLPSGFTLTAVYFLGFKAIPGIVCGSMFGLVPLFKDWTHPFTSFILLNITCTLANCIQPWIAVALIKKNSVNHCLFNEIKSALFFVLASILSPMISALMGITISCIIGTIEWKDYLTCWLSWWLASALAHLIFSPPLLLLKETKPLHFSAHPDRQSTNHPKLESWMIVGAALLIIWIDFFKGYPIAYTLFAVLIWSVFRLGNFFSSLLVVVASLSAILATSHGHGSFSDRTLNESIILLQSFIGILSITSLILSATVKERQAIEANLEKTLETLELRIEERTADLKRSEAQLDAFFSVAPLGMGIVDHHLRYTRVNQLLAKTNGIPEKQHLGRKVGDILPKLRQQLEPFYQQVLKTGKPVLNQEITGQNSANPQQHQTWLASYFPIFDVNQVPDRVGFVVMDITERKRLEVQLERQARIDGLTKISNRRHLDEVLQSEWQRCLRSCQPLSLILCDADYFKIYNDTYGHPMGDQCLMEIARILRQSTRRSSDLAARYGGEEFAVLLPNTTLREAISLAHVIRGRIHQLDIPHRGSKVSSRVTLSLGLATHMPQPGDQIHDFISCADRALYEAKQQGRDRIVSLPFNSPINSSMDHVI